MQMRVPAFLFSFLSPPPASPPPPPPPPSASFDSSLWEGEGEGERCRPFNGSSFFFFLAQYDHLTRCSTLARGGWGGGGSSLHPLLIFFILASEKCVAQCTEMRRQKQEKFRRRPDEWKPGAKLNMQMRERRDRGRRPAAASGGSFASDA